VNCTIAQLYKFLFVAAAFAGAMAAFLALRPQDFLSLLSTRRFMLPVQRFLKARKARRAEAQLPDALVMMKGSIGAGFTIVQAMETAASELGGPLGEELGYVVARMKLGASVDEALGILLMRVPCEDVELFVTSVTILRRTGGNMGECFGKLVETIERRRRVANRVRSLTAQGIAQALILLALPWFMLLALNLLAPAFIAPLFDTGPGNAALALVVLLEALGALWLRKIVVIRV
jgi:tight adherence protein B